MCIFIHIHMSYVYMYTWMQVGEIQGVFLLLCGGGLFFQKSRFPCVYSYIFICLMCIFIRGCRSVKFRACFYYCAVEGCFSTKFDFHVHIHTYSCLMYIFIRGCRSVNFRACCYSCEINRWLFSMCILIHIHMSDLYMYTWMQIGEIQSFSYGAHEYI